jgi:hypothetical protein
MRTQFVYVIGPETGPLKIGVATALDKRLQSLQIGCWHTLSVRHSTTVPADIAYPLERALHNRFKTQHLRGEWFDIPLDEAVAAVDSLAQDLVRARASQDGFSARHCLFMADDPAAAQFAVTRFRNDVEKRRAGNVSERLLARVGLASHVVFTQTIIERRDITATVSGSSHLARQAEASLVKALNGLVEIYAEDAAARAAA